jgi:hypothetical protein
MKSKGRLGESNAEDLPKVHLRAMPHGRMPAPRHGSSVTGKKVREPAKLLQRFLSVTFFY